ncbi:MAG: 3-hydroxyanthranilate 3,4-dioxygenase [Deltaproteobacteria bacterium]|nr:3-hydroxyanthranilate 3,4-dioxygenase [Deltaproteobacteria bacterium]
MPQLRSLNLKRWIDEHRHLLRPPVGNAQVYPDAEFIVMVVGGPNSRKDFHVDPGEELFFQLEGDMVLRVMEDGRPRDVPIREGELLLLPPLVPHSPQRTAGTVGLVVERQRREDELDLLRWYCERCHRVLHEANFRLVDITTQLKPVMEAFYASATLRTCTSCGQVMEPPPPALP